MSKAAPLCIKGVQRRKSKEIKLEGIIFTSKKEARRYDELKLLPRTKKISDLQLQKSFELQGSFKDKRTKKTIRSIVYICDFFYYDKTTETFVVEDVKGVKTDIYKLKKKLFIKKFGDTYELREV